MLILGSPLVVMLLFYLVDFTKSFPSFSIKPSAPLNDFIKHYEPAFYDAQDVANQHKRIRRATSVNANANQPLKLTITTPNKEFKLVLRPDDYLFADDVVFEGENGKMVQFDRSKVYVGTLEDDERAKVRGIVTKDGLFDGTITTQIEEFYVEPISRYKTSKHDGAHTIVYRTSDVTHPDTPLCSCSNWHTKHKPSDMNTIAHRSKRDARDANWPKFDNLFKSTANISSEAFRPTALFYDFPSANYGGDSFARGSHHHRQDTFYDLDLALPPPPPSPPPQQNFNYEINDTLVRLSTGKINYRPKSNPIDTVIKYTTNITKTFKGYQPSSIITSKTNPKILIGSGAEESRANLIITSDDSAEIHARKRAIVDPRKTTCMLYLQADHLFFEKYGTEETCIEVMTRHVQRVNSIYRNTDFNLDGKPDNISFMIKRIKVHSVKDPSYRFPGNYGVEKFLEIFSEEDYDAFCLAYMFTYRDFEMGTLGLAWTGDLKNAGGVCEKNGHYRGSLKSLNTGIVTVLNYGKHVPSAVSHVTLAHEIGHNFGSPHDPDGCTPGGDDGNFIMFARATSGDKKNNNKFSPCSLNAINPVLNVKARSSKGCFTEPQKSICGNGVVEADEECDCGWEEDCKDTCCYPQRRYPPIDEPPCRLTPKSVCSPSQGPCCTTDCKIKSGDMCRSDNGCRDSSYCNGINAQCPPSTNKPNKTVCNEEYVCYMGECTGSICLAYGLESCQCIPTASDPSTKACELCCKLPGENQPCLSSFQWNQAPYDVPDMFAKPGTPCNDYNGYCDVFRKCREVDPSGPIATLRKLLLSEENIASFKKWAYEHWYYCALIFFTFVLFMVISTKALGKKAKVKSVTVVHSSPTETVRLPEGDGGGPAVVVHPIVVRTKLPLKKKVREKRRPNNVTADENVAHNVNNNNSPVEAKKKKRDTAKTNAKGKTKSQQKSPKKETQVAAQAKVNTPAEDPLGKVRNWLINSHNMDGLGSLKKSKSSPASFDLSDANGVKKRQKTQNTSPNVTKPEAAKTNKKPKDNRVKLQVVYKPPFKFSVKLGKNKNEISSHLIKDKRPEAVKQRAALLIRADRIRANAAASNAVTSTAAAAAAPSTNLNDKNKEQSKSKNSPNAVEKIEKSTSDDVKAKRVEYKRSVSAPQTEPLYENTIFDNASSSVVQHDPKKLLEEPHYANVNADQRRDRDGDARKMKSDVDKTKYWPSSGTAAESLAHSAIKRSTSNDFRSSFSKPSSSGAKAITKRRNSYDTKHLSAASRLAGVEPSVEFVKRQYSDETDVISAAARNEFKRKSITVKRTNSGDTKPGNLSRSHPRKSTNYRKSYHDRSSGPSQLVDTTKEARNKKMHQNDYNLISFGSPSFDRSQPPKRKTSYDASTTVLAHDNHTGDLGSTKGYANRGHVIRSSSHSTRKMDGDKFKRYSLQGVAPAMSVPQGSANEIPNRTASVANAEFIDSPFHQQQYDIPSDLEVLLSETENPIGS